MRRPLVKGGPLSSEVWQPFNTQLAWFLRDINTFQRIYRRGCGCRYCHRRPNQSWFVFNIVENTSRKCWTWGSSWNSYYVSWKTVVAFLYNYVWVIWKMLRAYSGTHKPAVERSSWKAAASAFHLYPILDLSGRQLDPLQNWSLNLHVELRSRWSEHLTDTIPKPSVLLRCWCDVPAQQRSDPSSGRPYPN